MKTANFLPFLFSLLFTATLFSQSNIQQSLSVNPSGAAADASAQLDVSATDKGMLVPRMTTAQRTAIASPATGLLVFDTTTGGFWFYNGAWVSLSAPKTLQDTDGNTKVQVEKNANEDLIRFDLGGTENMVLRKNAGGSPRLEMPNPQFNTFVGEGAGQANTTGNANTATGYQALYSNTTGDYNTANGFYALRSNSTGDANTAYGRQSLNSNTIGYQNTATGYQALYNNSVGINNTANGYLALTGNTTGQGNTACGNQALVTNTTGIYTTALGHLADVTSSGSINATAIGAFAEVGSSNSLVLGSINGVNGATASVNVGIGITTPVVRLHVVGGSDASPAGGGYFVSGPVSGLNIGIDDNEIMARNNGAVSGLFLNNSGGNVKIGNASSKVGIGRSPVTNELEVEGTASKSSAGSWLANSDARLKKNIAPLDSREMLEKLLALQGVTYEWNDDKTGSKRPEGVQYGFTAQNIQSVFPTLVEEDKLGYLQTAYGTYDAMTVEAIRALNEEIGNLKSEIQVSKLENAALQTKVKTLEENQAAQLQKINAALAGAGILVEK